MAIAPHDAPASAAPAPGALYERWRNEPRYRLINLETDPAAWRVVPLDTLELLAFDQCLVFGAACPDPAADVDRAARRDRVVRDAWADARALYAAVAARLPRDRRLALIDELAAALADGVSSANALRPFLTLDPDPAVRAAATASAGPAVAGV